MTSRSEAGGSVRAAIESPEALGESLYPLPGHDNRVSRAAAAYAIRERVQRRVRRGAAGDRGEPGRAGEMSGRYYIRDTRQTVGNCALWWAKGGAGYTTQLEEAGEYEEEEALDIQRSRNTDKAIPVEVAQLAAVTHVRVEALGREMARWEAKRKAAKQ